MTYKLAIFDFDGTLADSLPFFASVVNDLAARHGFRAVTKAETRTLRRLSARDVMRHVGLPATKLPLVARDFVGRMRDARGSIPPFPGACDLLVNLARAGVDVGIVSSNAHDNVAAILGTPATAAIRHFACGMSIFGKRAHLRKVLKRSGVAERDAIYIGDQVTDLDAAHAEGLAFGAVAWGYADLAAFEGAGADYTFHDLSEIAHLLLGSRGPDASRSPDRD